MARFVILEHDHPHLHWDFLLEEGTALRTWRLEQPPRPGQDIAALALPAHRLHYLDYEGAVSGGRGTVRRHDRGTFTLELNEPGRVVVRLEGNRCRGRAELRHLDADAWLFHWFESCYEAPAGSSASQG
jgi:hypothetical protein